MMSSDKEIQTLHHHIRSYLDWIGSLSLKNERIKQQYTEALGGFISFVRNKEMAKRGDLAFDIPTCFNEGKPVSL